MEHNNVKLIDLNNGIITEPVRVCYIIDKKTKERLAKVVNENVVLTASMMVDLAINQILDDLEYNKASLVVNLNK